MGNKRKIIKTLPASEVGKKRYLSRGEIARIKEEEEAEKARFKREEEGKDEEVTEDAKEGDDDIDDILVAELPVGEVKRSLRDMNETFTCSPSDFVFICNILLMYIFPDSLARLNFIATWSPFD